ncbi:RNA polymerase sigma factor (sigma-70 family) [Paenibacillus anaericanus]|uniref:RNA polymerase sigma factor n=1 Tax=Paenibacillus anaericanus TaxID=170367 RepID=UPI002789F546|nr:RNA polymerase sigma factor [Paenibacillus anaericanus]MDQ0088044.1 RNA polymerase sigma factor (sigma-70 family) [Paenibacillus anaericanus]
MKFQQGDTDTFREIVQEYGNYVYRVTYSVLHDAKEAEDAAQETFLQVYKSLTGYRSQGFKSWLTRITVNKAIDMKRRRDRRREEQWDPVDVALQIPAQDDDILKGLIDNEHSQQIQDKISQLPPGHRDIVTAFYLEEKGYEEIAADQHIAVKTVESRLYRARAWIREHWKKEEEWR